RVRDSIRNLANTKSVMTSKHAAGTHCRDHKPAASVETEVVNETRNHEETEHWRRCPGSRRVQQARPRAPFLHPLGVNCGAHVLADDSNVFTKVEAAAQLSDSLLPQRDF